MKIVILSSSLNGSAAYHIPYLLNSKNNQVVMVVFNEGQVLNKKKHYVLKLKKIYKIGILGALIGVRMRKWFSTDVKNLASIGNLEIICRDNNIPFHGTTSINCKKTRELFEEANADLGISLGNGYIGPKVFSIPKYGMINIHHEILPDYQNASSVIWQIYNNSKDTGYTIHKIDKHIDTGEILFQEKIPIIFKKTLAETVSASYAALFEGSAKGLVKTLDNFVAYYNVAKPQGHGNSYTTPTIWEYIRMIRNHKKLKNQ